MENKYIKIAHFCDMKKTAIYGILNKKSNNLIGEIKWYGAWRQYCFFPFSDTVWNPDCLDLINKFIKKIMTDRR